MKSLILGGVKSGKSRYAENRVKAFIADHGLADESVCLIATAEALDSEMAARIQKHKEQRPAYWTVLEEPQCLADAIKQAEQSASIIYIDCLTLWLSNLLMKEDNIFLEKQIASFLQIIESTHAEIVMVSNETNMGVMPLGQLTRDYCDRAGRMHQVLASICDKVELIVAGLPLLLKSPSDGLNA